MITIIVCELWSMDDARANEEAKLTGWGVEDGKAYAKRKRGDAGTRSARALYTSQLALCAHCVCVPVPHTACAAHVQQRHALMLYHIGISPHRVRPK